MKPWRLLGGAALLLVVGGLAAKAQDGSVVDFSSWLQRQPSVVEGEQAGDRAQARQAVRERIAAVKASRDKVIPLTRSGRWQSERRQRSEAQPWHVQLQHKTDPSTELRTGSGAVTGTIAVVGSGLFSEGKIAGKINGTTVSGTVTDETGAQLATFTGIVSGTAMSGTYTTSDGDEGSWGIDEELSQ